MVMSESKSTSLGKEEISKGSILDKKYCNIYLKSMMLFSNGQYTREQESLLYFHNKENYQKCLKNTSELPCVAFITNGINTLNDPRYSSQETLFLDDYNRHLYLVCFQKFVLDNLKD